MHVNHSEVRLICGTDLNQMNHIINELKQASD